ncbi:MAG: hypothetical protein ACRERE_16605 [Candidatus Entotheonellia bacterium]
MEIVLAAATVLGGIAAIWYFWEKFRSRKTRKPSSEIAIEYKKEAPFEETEPAEAEGHALRHYRVRVRNLSASTLTNCIGKLEDVRRTDGTKFKNVFLPVGMMIQHQLLQQRQGGVFNLHAGEQKLAEVACLDETKPDSEIVLQYETTQYPRAVPREDYTLTLRAYGGNQPVEVSFRLYVDREGHLQFERYES